MPSEIKRALKWVSAALAVMFVVAFGFGATTYAALCSFKGDLQDRRDNSAAFLELTHEERIAKYGQVGDIPEETIRLNLANQQRTLDSLWMIYCP